MITIQNKELEEKIIPDVIKAFPTSDFFSKDVGLGTYVKIKEGTILENGESNEFININITDVHGSPILRIEKIVKHIDGGICIIHKDTNNSSGAELRETHITVFLGTRDEQIEEIINSIIAVFKNKLNSK